MPPLIHVTLPVQYSHMQTFLEKGDGTNSEDTAQDCHQYISIFTLRQVATIGLLVKKQRARNNAVILSAIYLGHCKTQSLSNLT